MSITTVSKNISVTNTWKIKIKYIVPFFMYISQYLSSTVIVKQFQNVSVTELTFFVLQVLTKILPSNNTGKNRGVLITGMKCGRRDLVGKFDNGNIGVLDVIDINAKTAVFIL